MSNFIGWTDEQIEGLINDVYNGVISTSALPLDLYEAILDRMDAALLEGFAGGFDVSEALADSFSDNVKLFSFAKTFQQINDMGNFISDGDGNQILFSDFKARASEIFEIYNNNWLETEFNTAKSIAESAKQWEQIQDQKDVLPLLRYSTAGDERVRAKHKELDGITLPVDHPFWKTHYTPNDFNCRCIVEQIEEGEISNIEGIDTSNINPMFSSNPALTGEVFGTDKHPYFNGLGDLIKEADNMLTFKVLNDAVQL